MLLSDNDMDELLRRAAADYPLKTDNADWARVEQGLAESEPAPANVSNRNIYWLLSLLLIPLLVLVKTGGHNNRYISKVDHDKIVDNNQTKTDLKNSQPPTTSENALSNSTLSSSSPIKNFTYKKAVSLSTVSDHKEITSINIKPVELLTSTASKTSDASNKRGNNIKSEIPVSPDIPMHKYYLSNLNETAENTNKQNSTVTENSQQIPTVLVDASSVNKEEKKKQILHRFYIGLTGSADVSMVKMQKTSKAGTSIGFLAGYQLNKYISLEAGAARSRKNYYSDGKYFDKTGLGITYNVLSVQGYCSMWEIPVSVKYTINPSKTTKFYARAGVSSYLMKEENYDYTTKYNNQYYQYNKVYTNASKNWFAVVQAGAGIEKKIGKNSDLRIEPNLSLPLSGMGVGKLKITSLGISAGITKKIF
ncbi:MAG: hypothetical protein JWN76_3139 [Chitinophagaceae bacterium]|nr:hypothetical protein [Chitinophagaceae bacterium]